MNGCYARFGKRVLDLLLVMVFLPVLLPMTALIIVCYILSANWPPMFVQDRNGRDGLPFRMLKFRTLKSDQDKPLEDRRFAWGSFLRRTGLDELPQLLHVLTGEMSLVGPRPLPPEYLPLYNESDKQRLKVRPGITGWAQINGRHGISWEEKFALDNYYADHISLKLDLKILFKTIVLFLSPGEDQSLKEEKFKGHQ
ncbi:MAG: sugar transferase [Bacteroidetes bacterium]|nr:sugar transferase [Bacteroidota bacterium]